MYGKNRIRMLWRITGTDILLFQQIINKHFKKMKISSNISVIADGNLQHKLEQSI